MTQRSPSGPPPIPDKLYFKIGEVSRLAAVQPHVLRFWEAEFPKIAPRRTASGQRLYTRRDVELILEVKDLLYRRKFTIEGARRHLRTGAVGTTEDHSGLIEELREELAELRRLLE
jgi:DNA-binding transcriptional MerR regulator